MNNTKEFYNNLRRDINNARTKRALRVLQKRGIKFYRKLNAGEIKSNIKREAKDEYLKSAKLIEYKIKHLKK